MRVESGFAENMVQFVNLLTVQYIIAHFIYSEISHFAAAAFHGKKHPCFSARPMLVVQSSNISSRLLF